MMLTHSRGSIHIDLEKMGVKSPKDLPKGHPLGYLGKKSMVETYLTRLIELFEGLPKGLDVLEYCGGVGLVARTCYDVLQPRSWVSVEWDEKCRPHWLEPRAAFLPGDMYTSAYYKSLDPANTLLFIDFDTNTLAKMWREGKRYGLFQKICDWGPRYFAITDMEYYWVQFPNHWPLYIEKFGVKPTKDNYHELFDRFMRAEFNYKVTKMTVGGESQYFLMEHV